MDAPLYMPLIAYHAPIDAPFQIGVNTASLAELKSAPATWDIVLKHAPMFEQAVTSVEIKPYLSTMTMADFINFGLIFQAQIDAIDADLVRLPRSQWPAL